MLPYMINQHFKVGVCLLFSLIDFLNRVIFRLYLQIITQGRHLFKVVIKILLVATKVILSLARSSFLGEFSQCSDVYFRV